MLENSIYSVISPEGCSSILWRSPDYVKQASESLNLTAKDCLKLGIIDEIIEELPGGAHRFIKEQFNFVKQSITKNIKELQKISLDQLKINRNEKYLNITSNS